MIKRLKEVRLERKKSQKNIADFLHITQQTYSDYETGRTNPDIETLIKIADLLEISVDYLTGRSDDFGNVTIINGAESLPASEQTLLVTFRSLPPDLQRRAAAYLAKLGELAEEEKAGTGNTSA